MPPKFDTRSVQLALAILGGLVAAFAYFADRFDRPSEEDGKALFRYGFRKDYSNSVLRADGSQASVRNFTDIQSADCRSDLPAGMKEPNYAIYTRVVRFTDEGGCDAFAVFNAQPRTNIEPKINGYYYGHWSLEHQRELLKRRGIVAGASPCKAGTKS